MGPQLGLLGFPGGLAPGAATPASPNSSGISLGSLGQTASLAGDAMGVVNGLNRGGVLGDTGAALSAVKGVNTAATMAGSPLYSSTSTLGSSLGAAGNVLGIVNGLRQGGIAGYGGAALNGVGLYGNISSLASSLGGTTAAGSTAAAAGGADAAASGADAATAGAGSLGAAATGVGAMAALAMYANGQMQDAADTITKVGPGQSVAKVSQNGQTEQGLQQGNMIYGAGGSRTGGSGNFFVAGPNGQQTWVGATNQNILETFASQPSTLKNVTYNPNATASDTTDLSKSLQSFNSGSGSFNTMVKQMGGEGGVGNIGVSATELSNGLSAMYNSLGGQKALGAPFSQWIQQISALRTNVSGGQN
jgi:hypothetical protein